MLLFNHMFTTRMFCHPQPSCTVPRYLYTTALTKSQKMCCIYALTFLSLLLCAVILRAFFFTVVFVYLRTLGTSMPQVYVPCTNVSKFFQSSAAASRDVVPCWGGARSNCGGSALAPDIGSTDLILMNDGRPTYFGLQGVFRMLDFTSESPKSTVTDP